MKNIRTCISCRKKDEKDTFLKIVRSKNLLFFDAESKINGRSIYLCKNETCINKAFEKNIIKHFLKIKTDDSLKSEVLEKIKNNI